MARIPELPDLVNALERAGRERVSKFIGGKSVPQREDGQSNSAFVDLYREQMARALADMRRQQQAENTWTTWTTPAIATALPGSIYLTQPGQILYGTTTSSTTTT